jgi:hypothetical protein
VVYQFFGMWAIRRAIRIVTADDPRPLRERLTHEARRILVAAAITVGAIVLGVIVLIGVLVAVAG